MNLGKKSQGLPMHVIIILLIGLVALAVVLMYIFGVFGTAKGTSLKLFDIGGNITENATKTASYG